MIYFTNLDLDYPEDTKEPIQGDESFNDRSSFSKNAEEQTTEENRAPVRRRVARQAPVLSLLDSVTQECEGITLRWLRPNIPFR